MKTKSTTPISGGRRPITRAGLLAIVAVCVFTVTAQLVSPTAVHCEESKAIVRQSPDRQTASPQELRVGDLYAVVVGVAKYSNSKIPQLKFSDKDAKDFAQFLRSQDKLFKSIRVELLVNEQATREKVE